MRYKFQAVYLFFKPFVDWDVDLRRNIGGTYLDLRYEVNTGGALVGKVTATPMEKGSSFPESESQIEENENP